MTMNDKDLFIYANELIEEIDEIIGNINFSSPYQNDNHLIVEGLERARDCVLDACTVDAVEVVHGQWVNPYINRYGHPCHCCSECGFKASYQDKNYCPNCGARMDGGN